MSRTKKNPYILQITNENMTKTIDCRGLFCPEPLLKLRTELPGAQESLTFLTDNEDVKADLSEYVSKHGHGMKATKVNEKEWKLEIFKGH